MKTLTITLHNTDNCGSSLQAFALQRFLLDSGVDNEIVDYNPPYIKYNGSKVRYLIRRILFLGSSVIRDKNFKDFKEEFLQCTKKQYTTTDSLKSICGYDCYITGSDQLWNQSFACGYDPAYYLKFADGRKISYAVSVGKNPIPQDNIDFIINNTKDYKWISVRENASKLTLQKAGVKNVDNVCDPVFLNGPEIYRKLEAPIKSITKPYILVYVAQGVNEKFLDEVINEVKNQMGCQPEVIGFGSYRKKCKVDRMIRTAGPRQFLYLIDHAAFVVSNSFHATMFSLIFRKQFLAVLPKVNGERIIDILDRLNLKDQYIFENSNISFSSISAEEYTQANLLLDNFVAKSKEALIRNIGKS